MRSLFVVGSAQVFPVVTHLQEKMHRVREKSSINDNGVGTAGVTGKMTQKGGSPLALIGPVQIDKCEQPLVEPALPLQDPVNLLNAYKGSQLSLKASTACSLI